jgi:hypothetical protein
MGPVGLCEQGPFAGLDARRQRRAAIAFAQSLDGGEYTAGIAPFRAPGVTNRFRRRRPLAAE